MLVATCYREQAPPGNEYGHERTEPGNEFRCDRTEQLRHQWLPRLVPSLTESLQGA